MKFNTLISLLENDFMAGLDEYELMSKPLYAYDSLFKSWFVWDETVGVLYNKLNDVKREEFLKSLKEKKYWIDSYSGYKFSIEKPDLKTVRENNDFISGVENYELMQKPLYYWDQGANEWLISLDETVGGKYKWISRRHDEKTANEFLNAMIANKVYGLDFQLEGFMEYYGLDPNSPDPFKTVKENNEFMDGIKEYEFMHKPIYYWSKNTNRWIDSLDKTVAGKYDIILRSRGANEAKEFINAIKANGVYGLKFPNDQGNLQVMEYFSLDPSHPNPFKHVKESNDFMDGLDEYELMSKKVQFYNNRGELTIGGGTVKSIYNMHHMAQDKIKAKKFLRSMKLGIPFKTKYGEWRLQEGVR